MTAPASLAPASGVGILGAIVWPVYVGACTEDPGVPPMAFGEPVGDPDYQRGQITWNLENGEIVGRAFIVVPAGTYTHQAYFYGPTGACMSGKMQLSQPITVPSTGYIEVYPITNPSMRLLQTQGRDY